MDRRLNRWCGFGAVAGVVAVGWAVSAAVGCTLEEWREVGRDAAARLPEHVGDVGANPTPGNLIEETIGFMVGLVAGWLGRKYGVRYGNVVPVRGGAPKPPEAAG